MSTYLLLQLPMFILGQDGGNQFQSVNQGVGAQQWDEEEDSPSPTGVSIVYVNITVYKLFICTIASQLASVR